MLGGLSDPPVPARGNCPSEARELVSFRLGEQEFGIDILRVREIRGWTKPTPLPHAPHHVRGTVNLRGVVLPIIDLAARLGLGQTEATARHAIIVVQPGQRQVGLLVDAVSDILTIANDRIQATPDIAGVPARSLVRGLVPVEDRMVSLLTLEELLPEEERQAA